MNDEQVCKQEVNEGHEIDKLMKDLNLTDESLMKACDLERSRQEVKMKERKIVLRATHQWAYALGWGIGAFLASFAVTAAVFEIMPAPYATSLGVVGGALYGACITKYWHYNKVRREALSIDTDRVRGGGLM